MSDESSEKKVGAANAAPIGTPENAPSLASNPPKQTSDPVRVGDAWIYRKDLTDEQKANLGEEETEQGDDENPELVKGLHQGHGKQDDVNPARLALEQELGQATNTGTRVDPQAATDGTALTKIPEDGPVADPNHLVQGSGDVEEAQEAADNDASFKSDLDEEESEEDESEEE